MSPRMLQRIALVLVVLLSLWGLLALIRRSSRETVASLTLPRLSAAEADSISYVGPHDTIRLRKEGGGWQVNGRPAAQPAVESFFKSLSDSSATSELVAESSTSHERLGVDTLHARRLTVSGGGKTLFDLWFGNRGPDFEGFYVRSAGTSRVFLLHGTFANLSVQPLDDWREKRILAVPADSLTAVEVTRGRSQYALTREAGKWVLPGAPPDSTKVARFLARFGELRATGFPSRAQEDSARFDRPPARLRLAGTGGRTLAELVFDSVPGGFLVRRVEGGPVYQLDQRLVNEIVPAESALVVSGKQ